MRKTLVAVAFALTSASAMAQQTAPPAPAFADANLSPQGVRALAANCATCHGTDGRPVKGSNVSALAGRSKDELVQLMAQFKSGQRPATIMHQISKGYSDAEIAAMADYFSKLSR